MQIYNSPLLEYPEISFDSIERIEIDNPAVRAFYRSFFSALHLPEKTLKSLFTLLIDKPI